MNFFDPNAHHSDFSGRQIVGTAKPMAVLFNRKRLQKKLITVLHRSLKDFQAKQGAAFSCGGE